MKKLLILIIGMFLFSGVSALDNQGTGTEGENFTFIQTCYDSTYITLLTIQFPNRSVEIINTNMTSMGGGSFQYNLTEIINGRYDLTGISDGCEKTFATYFEVTPLGFVTDITRGLISIGLLIILILFFVISLVGLFKIEDYKGKFALYWLCHLLIILIFFISWNLALGSLVSDSAISGIFKVMFYFSIFSVIPMMILSGAWIF